MRELYQGNILMWTVYIYLCDWYVILPVVYHVWIYPVDAVVTSALVCLILLTMQVCLWHSETHKLFLSGSLKCLLWLLCWFQTNLPLWWWYLFNCASATCRRGWPSGKQRQANRSITLPLCPPRQIADSWILFNSGAMPLGDKPKRRCRWELQLWNSKRWSRGKAASGKLVWNQH